MQEIHLHFPAPGQWDKFTLTAVYQDAEGYTHTDRYTQDDIPVDQAPAMAAVVSALVGLAAPWQASQVWARVEQVISNLPVEGEEGPVETTEAVVLTVEAVNDEGGRRTFTSSDYPAFMITDAGAIEFFRHFTTNQ